MGGTRFVGKALVETLLGEEHQLTLFTRGNKPIPKGVEHVKGDRSLAEDLQVLKGRRFDVIVDISGRTLGDTQKLLEITNSPSYRFIYMSSSGVYSKPYYLPIDEDGIIDPDSRHKGKYHTESWLIENQIPFTSFRPTYIYGPGNYNPIERWFFDRIIFNKPIPIPYDGEIITQLGHVSDLANAIKLSLDNNLAINRIYNISGKKYTTFNGLVYAAVKACSKNINDIEIKYFKPEKLDKKIRKLFPLRMEHYMTDVTRIQSELKWEPKFDLESGMKDSFVNDYNLLKEHTPDFSSDSILLGL